MCVSRMLLALARLGFLSRCILGTQFHVARLLLLGLLLFGSLAGFCSFIGFADCGWHYKFLKNSIPN